jgi:hypothetical protein
METNCGILTSKDTGSPRKPSQGLEISLKGKTSELGEECLYEWARLGQWPNVLYLYENMYSFPIASRHLIFVDFSTLRYSNCRVQGKEPGH